MHKITSPDNLTAVSEELRGQQQQYTTTVIVSSGTCGQARGSLSVVDAFHRELDRQELTGKVDFRTTGCHGFCEQEPAVIIEPEKENLAWIDKNLSLDLTSTYLFGNPAANLNAEVNVSLKNQSKTFDQFKNYSFSNETIDFKPISKNIFQGR